jgi:hypothetical protein
MWVFVIEVNWHISAAVSKTSPSAIYTAPEWPWMSCRAGSFVPDAETH